MANLEEPLLPNEPSFSTGGKMEKPQKICMRTKWGEKRQGVRNTGGNAFVKVQPLVERLALKLEAARAELHHWFEQTTDGAFIRSEINGRQSRRVVLVAFFLTDVIGANLWASWCTSDRDRFKRTGFGDLNACNTFGVNQYIVLILSLPIEGAALFMA
eukprot:2889007-Amphidinium_carterae.1